MLMGRVGHDGLHQFAEFGRNQLSGFQKIIKARDLQGGGAVGQIVERIAPPGGGLAVFFADPDPTISFRIIESITGGLQQIGQIIHSDTVKDIRCRRVG